MSTPVTYRDLLIDRYRRVYDWVPAGTARVLDVGCGNGHFTKWLRQRAGQVFGVDHNPRNCRAGAREYPDLRLAASAAEGLPFADGSFDCVVCSDTIEHTDSDQAAVDELLRVLAPGGTLVLSMPQGGLFGWLDAENLVPGLFELVRRLRLPKPGGGRVLEAFRFRRHRHYNLAKVESLLAGRLEIQQVYRSGLLLYPLCYLVEKAIECFLGRDLVSRDYRLLRRLRACDYDLAFGPAAFNIALVGRKKEAA